MSLLENDVIFAFLREYDPKHDVTDAIFQILYIKDFVRCLGKNLSQTGLWIQGKGTNQGLPNPD